eukprot:Opistho-2@68516
MASIVVRGSRVLRADGSILPGTVFVEDGKIVRISDQLEAAEGFKVVDAGDNLVMPGIVDSHVHINEPGRTMWEGFETATRAAAAGGVTTIIDMPLNSIPPTTTVDNLKWKLDASNGQLWVDVGFWGGVIPNNHEDVQPLVNAGVRGFKCFLINSGVDEFPHVVEADLHKAMKALQGTDSVLLFHAEVDTGCCVHADADVRAYDTFLKSRPQEMECAAIELVVRLCREYRVRCHIVHLSAATALPLIRAAKNEGLPLTAETCHHYLYHVSESIPDGATQYKCCPPIRERSNRDLLWDALRDGTIDMVVSDHSPCTADLKKMEAGDFMAAWGGIASVQFGPSILRTAAGERGFAMGSVQQWAAVATSKLARVNGSKGTLEVGKDGDIVVWDADTVKKVEVEHIHHRNKVTPYLGKDLKGVVRCGSVCCGYCH